MQIDNDIFDGIVQADINEVAPGMIEAILESLRTEFEVGEFTPRSVLVADGDIVTIRWAVDCTDRSKEARKITFRALTVHGLSLVGGPDGERVVAHYIDWAGVMAQLGMTTSRPSAVDVSNVTPG